jgi:hypothetical protein
VLAEAVSQITHSIIPGGAAAYSCVGSGMLSHPNVPRFSFSAFRAGPSLQFDPLDACMPAGIKETRCTFAAEFADIGGPFVAQPFLDRHNARFELVDLGGQVLKAPPNGDLV